MGARDHLRQALEATSRRQAYEIFERAIRLLRDPATDSTALLSYLEDPNGAFKETLLSAMADYDLPLCERVIKLLSQFLSAQSRDLAQSASQALFAGGDAANKMLAEALSVLPTERRKDLEQLLSLVRAPVV